MTPTHDIHVLNGLFDAAAESARLYDRAAAETEDFDHRDLYLRRAAERRRLAEGLAAAIRARGGRPGQDGSILAKARQAIHDMRHALIRDEIAAVGSVHEGEDHLRARLDRALTDPELSEDARAVIRAAHGDIAAAEEDAAELRRRLQSRRDAEPRIYPQ
jgi:uncharacterized protein (TIGR02284 family)